MSCAVCKECTSRFIRLSRCVRGTSSHLIDTDDAATFDHLPLLPAAVDLPGSTHWARRGEVQNATDRMRSQQPWPACRCPRCSASRGALGSCCLRELGPQAKQSAPITAPACAAIQRRRIRRRRRRVATQHAAATWLDSRWSTPPPSPITTVTE